MIKDRGGSGLTSPNSPTNPSGGGVNIEDCFSTYVYTCNGATQDIVNGINLADDGGMVWTKCRDYAYANTLLDTERGLINGIFTEYTDQAADLADGFTSYNSNGYTLAPYVSTNSLNKNNYDYVSWTFKKQPRFFDMVKYTGNGVAGREIPHELGCDVGMIIVKGTTAVGRWYVYHKSNGATKYMELDTTIAAGTFVGVWNDVEPSDTNFTLGDYVQVNADGEEYIAYLFADDPLGASGDGSDGMIACGSYVGNGTSGVEIDLGWEPQFVLVKRLDATGNWFLFDTMRGFVNGSNDSELNPNTSDQELTTVFGDITPTGFYVNSPVGELADGGTYIYMAIRRGMKEPTTSSDVFAIDNGDGNSSVPYHNSGFPVDMAIRRDTSTTGSNGIAARLTGNTEMKTESTEAESNQTYNLFDYMEGWNSWSTTYANYYSWMFKRAKGFMTVTAITDTGSSDVVKHDLGVVPELILGKCRSTAEDWYVYHKDLTSGNTLRLNTNAAEVSDTSRFTGISDTQFTYGGGTATRTRIFYMFASLAGISKVFSYVADGVKTIDCGFTTGTKMLILKRKDSTGNWLMFDSTRGLVTGNDNVLKLDTTDAETTNTDLVDPHPIGFISNIVDNGNYIGYAISN